MFKKKAIGIVALTVGIIGIAISLLSDILGITCNKNVGWLQLTGIIVAAVILIVGIILLMGKKK